jgi:ArsR family transcriptional regulator, arsenate/arsenite/antimonite-responsive transcriptional repressor
MSRHSRVVSGRRFLYRILPMDQIAMNDEDFATALRALGHPVRLSILRILKQSAENDCCCTDVTQCLPLAQSTVSQHIKVLLDAGLVERRQRGTRNCYSLRADRLAAIEGACSDLLGSLASQGLVPA